MSPMKEGLFTEANVELRWDRTEDASAGVRRSHCMSTDMLAGGGRGVGEEEEGARSPGTNSINSVRMMKVWQKGASVSRQLSSGLLSTTVISVVNHPLLMLIQ